MWIKENVLSQHKVLAFVSHCCIVSLQIMYVQLNLNSGLRRCSIKKVWDSWPVVVWSLTKSCSRWWFRVFKLRPNGMSFKSHTKFWKSALFITKSELSWQSIVMLKGRTSLWWDNHQTLCQLLWNTDVIYLFGVQRIWINCWPF